MSDNGFRKENYCPYCNYKNDAATMPGDPNAIPTAGDLTFCLKCSECSQFDENMKLIKFDIDSIENKKEVDRLKKMQNHIRDFWKAHPELKVGANCDCH